MTTGLVGPSSAITGRGFRPGPCGVGRITPILSAGPDDFLSQFCRAEEGSIPGTIGPMITPSGRALRRCDLIPR